VGVTVTGGRSDELVVVVVWGILENEEAVEGEGEVDKES
jgi:hypothetical protein